MEDIYQQYRMWLGTGIGFTPELHFFFNGEGVIHRRRYGGVLKMRVPQNGWFIREHEIKIDDLGVAILGSLNEDVLIPWFGQCTAPHQA